MPVSNASWAKRDRGKPRTSCGSCWNNPRRLRLVVRKLFRWLVSEVDEASDELIEPLAKMLGQQFDVGQVVETMLRSNLFFSDHAMRRCIKSPVEYVLGMVKAFGALVPTSPLGEWLAQLGQDLYAPPTTRGWVGGTHWINAATMLGRENLAAALLAGSGPMGGKFDPQALTARHAVSTPPEQAKFLLRLLLQDDAAPASYAALADNVDRPAGKGADDALRQLTYQIVTLPEYQLC